MLSAVKALTEEAWQIPYSIRVDSITNFQATYGVDDDLIVEDLVGNPQGLSAQDFEAKKQVALNEPLLRSQLVTEDATVTAVNVVLQYPEKKSE